MDLKKVLKYALPAVGAAAVAVGVTAYLIAPEKASEEKKRPFVGANIAHRGLHRADGTIPENSLKAFLEAVNNGYGVEFDVHITRDDHLVVFHDDTLLRMCGVEENIEDLTYAELQKYDLGKTREKIPLLSEVLMTIGGKTPIILELKRGKRNRELCERTYDMLRAYRGDVCVESFDPMIVRWWRKHAPEVLRGQLSCTAEQFGDQLPVLQSFALSRLLTNFLSRPNFIAYGVGGKKPLTVRLSERMGAMKVAWTSHNWETEDHNDTVIFEFYRPRQRFK